MSVIESHSLKLKPSIINALLPAVIQSITFSIIITAIMYMLIFILSLLKVISFSFQIKFLTVFLPFLVFVFIPFSIHVFYLWYTTYYFYTDRVVKEFRFIALNKQSVFYDHIINITVEISIWDRLTSAGDIILHTADDKEPEVVLKFIPETEEVEKLIYKLIKKGKHKD